MFIFFAVKFMFDDIEGLCVPALIFLIFGTTRVIMDTYKGMYNLAFMQIFITILFTYLLNVLCRGGLGIISWIIVAIPFLLMSIIAAILLGVFGLNPATGNAIYSPQVDGSNVQPTSTQPTNQNTTPQSQTQPTPQSQTQPTTQQPTPQSQTQPTTQQPTPQSQTQPTTQQPTPQSQTQPTNQLPTQPSNLPVAGNTKSPQYTPLLRAAHYANPLSVKIENYVNRI